MIKDFEQSMLVTDETEGCLGQGHVKGERRLSIPHTAALIDFDGDCLSDLFITVVDSTTSKTYYEIFLRREKESVATEVSDEEGNGN